MSIMGLRGQNVSRICIRMCDGRRCFLISSTMSLRSCDWRRTSSGTNVAENPQAQSSACMRRGCLYGCFWWPSLRAFGSSVAERRSYVAHCMCSSSVLDICLWFANASCDIMCVVQYGLDVRVLRCGCDGGLFCPFRTTCGPTCLSPSTSQSSATF